MNCKRSDFVRQLQQSFEQETNLINGIRKICGELSWVDDPVERSKNERAIKAMTAQLVKLQDTSEVLLKDWQEANDDLPAEIERAKENKRSALVGAIEAVLGTVDHAQNSKGTLLGLLADVNRTQEMLGAYDRR